MAKSGRETGNLFGVASGEGDKEGVSIHWTGLLDWNTGLDWPIKPQKAIFCN